jgi:protein ImuA
VLPAQVAAAVWRGDQLGQPVASVWPSGFAALDAVLPGGGWPGQAVTELLSPQAGTHEWRLLGPLLRQVTAAGRPVLLVGPPRPPHPAGLRHEGVDERRLVWVQAETPAERLWTTEQLLRARTGGVLLAWLPQVRAEQVRRLQVQAGGHETPVFLCRPEAALHEASAAPLRLRVGPGSDWTLQVELPKRKGPPLTQPLSLHVVPGGLRDLLTPRLQQPSRLVPSESTDAVVRPVPAGHRRRALSH